MTDLEIRRPHVRLTRLALENFRNYAALQLRMDGRHVCLYGANGSGKTNLMEAVSMLSPGRGLRGARACAEKTLLSFMLHFRRAPSGVAYAPQSSGLLFADKDNDKITRVSFVDNGVYTEISGTITRPNMVEFDPIHARTFFSETNSNTVRMIDYGGGTKVVAGNGTPGFSGDGGPGASAQLYDPSSVAVDSRGNVYIADTGNHAVRMVVGGALP